MIFFDDNGDPSTAIKLDENLIEIRKDLLFEFCAAKQMALVVFVDSFRFSQECLENLSSEELREVKKGNNYRYDYCLLSYTGSSEKGIKTMGRIVGKKIILPKPFPRGQRTKSKENFQSFIVGNDDEGQVIKHVCGPNLDTPTYLTPVFFRKEVLHKYYSNPKLYKVEDGHLWCGRLWHIAIDNDHDDYVAVYLGDLGRDLRETERNYWLSHNISPYGKKISKTEFARSFMGEWCESTSIELVFKRKYIEFRKNFHRAHGWDFFLNLHEDDEHCLESMYLPENNIADFEKMLGWIVKLLIDSLNEKEISVFVKNLETNDKGITKLEKCCVDTGVHSYNQHIAFLRLIQDARSKITAHRKGSSYNDIKKTLNLHNEGYKQKFKEILKTACSFLEFLHENFIIESFLQR